MTIIKGSKQTMKSILEQLSTYKSVHLNSNNVKTHVIGIPMIIWAVMVLIGQLPWQFNVTNDIGITVLDGLAVGVVLYYLLLHLRLAIVAVLCFAPIFYTAKLALVLPYDVLLAIAVFVVGWIFQFIGHGYEKAKPAFVDDINQLLIGPLFLIAELYFYLKFEPEFAEQVDQLAIEKRQLFEQRKAAA